MKLTRSHIIIIFFGGGLFLLLPLIRLESTLDHTQAIRFLVTAIPLALLFLYKTISIHSPVFFPKFFLQLLFVLLLSLLWMGISSIHSINFGDALWEILRIGTIFLFVPAVFIFLPNEKNLVYILGKLSLLAVLIFSTYALFQLIPLWEESKLKGLPLSINLELSSNLGNKNFFSEVMLMLLPFLIVNFIIQRKGWKPVFAISILITAFWILLLQSASAYLALLIGCLAVPVMIVKNPFKRFKEYLNSSRKPKIIIIAMSVIGLSILCFLFLTEKINFSSLKSKSNIAFQYFQNPDLIDSTGTFNDNSVFERILLWRNSYWMIVDNPILGSGLNNWKILQAQYGTGGTNFINSGLVRFEHPHNDYLLILSEQGPIGLLLYLCLFIFPLIRIRRSLIQNLDKDKRIILPGLALALFSFMIISFFAYPRSRFYVMLILVLYVTLIYILSSEKENHISVPFKSLRLIFFFCFLFSVFSCFAAWHRIKGEIHTKEILRAQYSKNFARMERETRKARSFFYPMDYTGTPLSWYEGMAYFYSANYLKAREKYEEALEVNPYHLRVLNDLATSYEKSGKPDKAIEMYKRALIVAPHFTESLLNLSATYYNTGQLDSALISIEKIHLSSITYRDSQNYQTFYKAILLGKIHNHLKTGFTSNVSETYMNIIAGRNDLIELYKLRGLNFEVFLNELLQSIDHTNLIKEDIGIVPDNEFPLQNSKKQRLRLK